MEAPARKRGFDIASLVDHSDDTSSKKRKSIYPSIINSSTFHLTNNNNHHNESTLSPAAAAAAAAAAAVSLRDHFPFFSSGLKLEGLAAQLAEAHSNVSASSLSNSDCVASAILPRMSTGQISAFKKVDKSTTSIPVTGLPSSLFASSLASRSTGCNLIAPPSIDQSSSIFLMPNSVNMRQSLSHDSSSVRVSPLSSSSSSSSSLNSPSNGNNLSASHNNNNNSIINNNNNTATNNNNNNNITCASKNGSVDNNSLNSGNCLSKPLITPSLLPFLPPSLAALSFPHTNWCAKCNASFRMTSDLVYHMRSHHKPFANSDPIKKKREEKLRCNICGESFRERHHLTRHLTSHQ